MSNYDPIPPDILASALQDKIHKDVGRGRACKSVRVKMLNQKPNDRTWESALAYIRRLVTISQGVADLTDATAAHAEQVLDDLRRQIPHLPPPAVGVVDGMIGFTWRIKNYYLNLEVFPNEELEQYYEDLSTGYQWLVDKTKALDPIFVAFLSSAFVGELPPAIERLVRIGRAVDESDCDMMHNFRCEAWQVPDSATPKRRSDDPLPDDPSCTCGLKEIAEAQVERRGK